MRAVRKTEASCVTERREATRFKVSWTIKVSFLDANEFGCEETGVLRDISATGAYGIFTNRFEVGRSVKVMIKLPLRREGWISYPARVLRVESWESGSGLAFLFDAARPSFVARI